MFHGSSAEVLMRESRVFGAFFVKTYRRADSGLMIWRMGTQQQGTLQVMVGFQCPKPQNSTYICVEHPALPDLLQAG